VRVVQCVACRVVPRWSPGELLTEVAERYGVSHQSVHATMGIVATDVAAVPTFPEGSTVIRRDTLRGKLWSATPYRVIRDTGPELAVALWPGVEMLSPSTWIEWLRTGDHAVRKQAIPNLAAGRWALRRWVWRDTTVLARFERGQHFCVSQFFDPQGRARAWYIDFIRPYQRTPDGIDTLDLLVDLVVTPDLSAHRWKDEDEYAQGRRLGLINDTLHRRVEAARQRVMALVESRQGPFAEDWSSWRRDPSWPLPTLPPRLNGQTRALTDH
jgi:protein associated with RNAse G/E